MKAKTKRILGLFLTICMGVTLITFSPIEQPQIASAATYPPSSRIYVNNGQVLYSLAPYLVNGVASAGPATLGSGGCTAHFNHTTGVLTLQGYNGGAIRDHALAEKEETVIKLIGSNTITADYTTSTAYGIVGFFNYYTITADSAATLNINVSSGGNEAYGIAAGIGSTATHCGTVTIAGKANVVINAKTTSENMAMGINSKEGVSVLDDASLTVICSARNAILALGAAGIYTLQKTIINTTGNVSIDVSDHISSYVSNYAIWSSQGTTLTKVNLMTLKWAAGGYPNMYSLTYNESNFSVVQNDTTRIKTFRWGAPLTFTSNPSYNVPAGFVNAPITSFSVSAAVTGGFGTKTFTKVSGPAWLSVSSTGMISGTRPAAGSLATTATIRVTDADGAWKQITIDVGAVTGANAAATSVTIYAAGTAQTLSAANPYLVNNLPMASGTLNGGTCTAYYNASNGVLSLWNYNGGQIECGMGSSTAGDLTVSLQGTNTITNNSLGQGAGIRNRSGGNLTITAPTAATLNITVSGISSGTSGLESNYTGQRGDIIIKGNSSVNINISTTTALVGIYGVQSMGKLDVLDNASLNIVASGVTGGAVCPVSQYTRGIINTTGNITADMAAGGAWNAYSWSGGFILNNVGLLTLKWTAEGSPHQGTALSYDENAFIVKTDTVNRIKTFKPGAALSFTHKLAFDIPLGYVGTAISGIDVSSGASGGTGPYGYEKVSGPSWLNVGGAGSITGTRPATSAAATTMKVRVNDADGNYKEITIDVGEVKYYPVQLTAYSSDFNIPPGVVATWGFNDMGNLDELLTGGSGQYNFDIESGPEWVGKFSNLCGWRPATPQAATTALIKVYDIWDDSNATWITIDVGEVVAELSYDSEALDSYAVPAGEWNTVMTPIDLKPLISGGFEPYSFEASWGHEWVSVSEDGILSGTRPGSYRTPNSIMIEVSDDDFNTVWFYIPIGEVYEPLSFIKKTYNIPASTVGTAITSIDVGSDVVGGLGELTFSAIGLPAGISINSASGIISGTPTTATAAGTATITVTDEAGTSKSITITYGAVTVAVTILYGDVNDDGVVDGLDALYLARHLAGWLGYVTITEAADVNGDGNIDGLDALYLARHLAGWSGYETLGAK